MKSPVCGGFAEAVLYRISAGYPAGRHGRGKSRHHKRAWKGSDADSVFIERIQVDVLPEKEGDKDATGAQGGEMHLKDDRSGNMHGTYQEREAGEYRRMIAEVLGIEVEQVEVIYGGGR